MNKKMRLYEDNLNGIVESAIKRLISEKHAPFGTSGKRQFVKSVNPQTGKREKTTYYNVPNLPKFNKSQNFKPGFKFQRVNARQVEDPNGEDIDTILKDGTVERRSHTPKGDYVLKNISSPEQWPVDAKTFAKRYELDPEQDGVYKPKGGPMYASEPTRFNMVTKPPTWGGYPAYMKKGGRIMVTPGNENDTYPNAEFGSGTGNDGTYKFYDQDAPYKPLKQLNAESRKIGGKTLVRLTEGDLRRIVKESVNKIIKEHDMNALGRVCGRALERSADIARDMGRKGIQPPSEVSKMRKQDRIAHNANRLHNKILGLNPDKEFGHINDEDFGNGMRDAAIDHKFRKRG